MCVSISFQHKKCGQNFQGFWIYRNNQSHTLLLFHQSPLVRDISL
ncbi:TPA: hypothetical protein ACPP5G_001526 [Haemophilus influenzae]